MTNIISARLMPASCSHDVLSFLIPTTAAYLRLSTGSTCIQAETLYEAHNPLPKFKATKVYSRFVLCSNGLLNSMPTYQPSTSSTTRHHPRWIMRWHSFTATKLERVPQGTKLQTIEDEFDSVEDFHARFCELVCSAIFRKRALQALLRPEVVHNDKGICNI